MFNIIKYDPKFKEGLVSCYVAARYALEAHPDFHEDIFDIEANYFHKGDMFWIAIDNNSCVVGMLGTATISQTDMWLKRLFIEPKMKRKGIASSLLKTVEEYAKSKNIVRIHTRFNSSYDEASHFYLSKGFLESKQEDEIRYFVKNMSCGL